MSICTDGGAYRERRTMDFIDDHGAGAHSTGYTMNNISPELARRINEVRRLAGKSELPMEKIANELDGHGNSMSVYFDSYSHSQADIDEFTESLPDWASVEDDYKFDGEIVVRIDIGASAFLEQAKVEAAAYSVRGALLALHQAGNDYYKNSAGATRIAREATHAESKAVEALSLKMTNAEQAIHGSRVDHRDALASGDAIRAEAAASDIASARIIARDARAARDAASATYNAVYIVALDRAMIPVDATLLAAHARWLDALADAEAAIDSTIRNVRNISKTKAAANADAVEKA